ncbi:MAG TPA: cytochrome c peroxidase [Bacteroidales bacterium]|nr:cytochrome c peroxidase [Bacteroidales bacterium]
MKQLFFPVVLLALIFQACSGGNSEKRKLSEADQMLLETAKRYFATLPQPNDPNTPLAILGKKLYYETALSANGQLSCNSCHPIISYGVDNKRVSPGHDGSLGNRNSPTTFNAWFHVAQFWDGRSPDLADQAKGPVLNPIEMGLQSPEDVVSILKSKPEYVELFAAAFPGEEDPITFDNFAKAVAEFEGTLATPAAFDAFLDGAVEMLDDQQKQGLSMFIETGCIACHIGPGLGGNMMQRFGLVHGPYYEFTGSESDPGRAAVTGNEADKYVFKTPSLRNIEMTAPYFHDGSVESLEEAIRIMAYTQLGKELSNEDIEKLIAFFRSLTGKIPEYAL